MVGMQNLIPRWLHQEYDMQGDEMHLPPIATLPSPPRDERQIVIEKAAAAYHELKRERETTQVELAEAILAIESEKKKTKFLENENAELRLVIAENENMIATLQADNLEYRRIFSLGLEMNTKLAKIYDSYGIKAPPKKVRAPRKHKVANATATNDRPAI